MAKATQVLYNFGRGSARIIGDDDGLAGGNDGVRMHQSRQAKVRVVQRSRGPRASDLAPQLSVGRLLLSTGPSWCQWQACGLRSFKSQARRATDLVLVLPKLRQIGAMLGVPRKASLLAAVSPGPRA
jgi:hypothetical protein